MYVCMYVCMYVIEHKNIIKKHTYFQYGPKNY